jgi:hypothetical protein
MRSASALWVVWCVGCSGAVSGTLVVDGGPGEPFEGGAAAVGDAPALGDKASPRRIEPPARGAIDAAGDGTEGTEAGSAADSGVDGDAPGVELADGRGDVETPDAGGPPPPPPADAGGSACNAGACPSCGPISIPCCTAASLCGCRLTYTAACQ